MTPIFSSKQFRLCLAFFFLIPCAFAQSTGSINGSAQDSAGSALRGARVELEPSGRKATTDDQGQFRFADVPAGDYTVEITYVGFSSFSQKVKVDVSMPSTVTASLQVASRTDEVIVRSERLQGETEAINIERTSDNLVQILPAKVINSLPNFNIADAVGRVPSVTLERDEGEGKYVQIRGTEPRLSNVTINGVHVPSPEGAVRNIKLDAVPASLVERIEVFKTLLPNQDADAIGGSVNLVTRIPSSKPFYSFSAQGGYTPIQEGKWLSDYSAGVGRRFGKDDKLGVLVGGTWDHNDRGIDDLEPGQAIGTSPDTGAPFALINTEDFRTYHYNRTRYGADGTFDYNFQNGSTMYLKAFYSNFLDYGNTYVYTPNAGSIVSHTGNQTIFDNTGNAAYREYQRRPDQGVYSVALGGNKDFASTLLTYQLAASRSHNYGGQDFPTTKFAGPQSVTYALDESNPYRPKLSPIDGTNVLDPTAYLMTSTTITHYVATQLNLEGEVSLAHSYSVGSHPSTFEAGFEVRNAHKLQEENDLYYSPNGNVLMSQFLSGQTNSNYYDHSFTYGPLTDFNKIQSYVTSNLQNFTLDPSASRIQSDPATWDALERVYSGYLMDSISVGKWRLVGGLRIEATDTGYRANRVTLNSGAYSRTDPVKGGSSYINLAPSLQAQYLLTPNTNLRASVSRSISRPNFQDLVPAEQADPNGSPANVVVGNPNLVPTKANNYDILIEHYFQPLGIVQAGYFYKALSDPIYPTAAFLPANDPNFPGFLRQESINGPSAWISGIETSWQQRFSFLPGLMNGLGVSINYSYAASRVTFPTSFSSAVVGGQGRIDHPRLQRQAPNTWNVGLTYDKSRFSMRFAISHNDANIYAYQYVHDPTTAGVDQDPILGIKGPLGDQYLYAHTQYDLQGSYRVYRGFEVFGSGLNLSNEVFGFYTGRPIFPNQREYYKPTAIFGIRWNSAIDF